MVDNEKRRPILGGGENLINSITKRGSFPVKTIYPRNYDQAKNLVQNEFGKVNTIINELPESKKMNEVVLTIRVNEKFLAKSYTPNSFFSELGFQNIGSRSWSNNNKDSKLYFGKIAQNHLRNYNEKLANPPSETFKDDVRTIEEINILEFDEVVQGFDSNWREGRVEFVIHPYSNQVELLKKFEQILIDSNINRESVKVRAYDDGPIFISAIINSVALNNFKDFNPLRTVHPLEVELKSFEDRHPPIPNNFLPPIKSTPLTKVGVIDGGIHINNSLVSNYTTQTFEIGNPASNYFKDHGTAVSGLVLYGDLNKLPDNSVLPSPTIGVESIRVFPTATEDIDLYDSIDIIENSIPQQDDITVYNLSIGPSGMILDDVISRFTFVLDKLSYEYKKLFVVAVGNNGEKRAPFNRIEAPADAVNALGVGSYRITENGSFEKAKYSCVGGGREGAKVKPDIVEFGGCSTTPVKLIGESDFLLTFGQGTSYSSPLVARKAAELLVRGSNINHLTTKGLLIHSAHGGKSVDKHIGYGYCVSDVNEILNCNKNKVTIIYNNSISVKKYAKVPIPLPHNIDAKKFRISWTIVTESSPNALSTESYTMTSIEETFYPHAEMFKLNKIVDGKTKTKKININEKEKIENLIADGWALPKFPDTKSGSNRLNEEELRKEMKWDTVIKKHIQMNKNSLLDPFLIIHGLDRTDKIRRINFSVIITVEAIESTDNLYEEILNQYSALNPISIRNENEIQLFN